MADFYLLVFIGICTAILAWSIIRLERIYQYPFSMMSVFLPFILILPQAIADSLTKVFYIFTKYSNRME